MSMGDQIGVDHIDREADWPHILNKQTRFCNVALRVTNMRWGRRCVDCSEGAFRFVAEFASCKRSPREHGRCPSRARDW